MANYIVTGPVVDLELHAASSDARHDAHLGVPMQFANGKVAMLVRANGAITRGHFCGVTGLAHDAQALTTSIVGTLTDEAAEQMDCGYAQATAADNEVFWLLLVKPNGSDTDGYAFAGGAITAGAKSYTTATAGRVDDTAGANHRITNFEVTTDPASAIEFTTFECNHPKVLLAPNVALTQTYSTADATLAATTSVAITDNGTGSDVAAFAAGVGRYIASFPFEFITSTSAIDVATAFTPGHRFKIISWSWIDGGTALVGGSGSRVANMEIGTTDVGTTPSTCTVVQASTAPGRRIDGTAVSGANVGSASDTFSIEIASGGTDITAGNGAFHVVIQNMDTADAFAALSVEHAALIADINDAKQFINTIADALQDGATLS